MKKYWKILLVVLFVAVMLPFFVVIKKNPKQLQKISNPEKEVLKAGINGVLVKPETAEKRPVAVMVENHIDSRPQSGLSKADIVYEALAEGGITRFLAVYQTMPAEEIGPVRSAREYFATIADEWLPVYAHVGGSNEVIQQLKEGKYKGIADANEYFNFEFFPRREDKPKPHHIFTSTKKLEELMVARGFSASANHSLWKFKEDAPKADVIAPNLEIDFSKPGFEVTWVYDKGTNTYKRLQYFQPHIDALTDSQIQTKTVILQLVKVTPVPKDPLLSIDVDLESGGRALVFQDGGYIDGRWKKTDGKTRFYDLSGEEVSFNRGILWVELVPSDREIYLKF